MFKKIKNLFADGEDATIVAGAALSADHYGIRHSEEQLKSIAVFNTDFFNLSTVISNTNNYKEIKPHLKTLAQEKKLFNKYINTAKKIISLDKNAHFGFCHYSNNSDLVSVAFILIVDDGLLKRDALKILNISNVIINKRLKRFNEDTFNLIPCTFYGIKKCDSIITKLENYFKNKAIFENKISRLREEFYQSQSKLHQNETTEKNNLLKSIHDKYVTQHEKLEQRHHANKKRFKSEFIDAVEGNT
jgi:hypothetical protein